MTSCKAMLALTVVENHSFRRLVLASPSSLTTRTITLIHPLCCLDDFHSFVKKALDTTPNVRRIAETRLKEVKNGNT